MSINIQSADNAIVRFMAITDRIITLQNREGRKAAVSLIEMLARADRRLSFRLRRAMKELGGRDMRFSETSFIVYQTQIREVIEQVKRSLAGVLEAETFAASTAAYHRVGRLFGQLEKAFTGVVVPIRLREAAILELRASLLARHATSLDRYGEAMIRKAQSIMAEGIITGRSQFQMVEDLIKIRGPEGVVSLKAIEIQPRMVVRISEETIPEGLFMRYRSWPWRIVRTEVAEAQNAAHMEAMEEFREDFPDLQKKILATFDRRTAWDSVGVHGQIRPLEGYFQDGAGRVYQRPPSRPNDRETVIPWRSGWPETKHSAPPTQKTISQMKQIPPKQRREVSQMATQTRRNQAALRREVL